MTRKIAIIGAGVIGTALAYRLQGPQADVTVIDANAQSATDASFGWINASFYLSEAHFQLRAAGIAAYARLAQELQLPLRSTGCLNWEFEGQDLDEFQERLAALDYPVDRLDASQFQDLAPAIASPPEQSLLFPSEAAAEPAALRHALLAAAQQNGARFLSGVRVTSMEGGLETTAGRIHADEVIIAAGIGSEALMQSKGLRMPMLHRPAYIVETTPLPPLLNHVLAGPMGEVRQSASGAIIAPAAVSHQSDAGDIKDTSAPDAADATIARLRLMFPDVPMDWAKVTLAQRPVPGDNLPVIGRVDEGVYLATMHSGLTLAAITAELAATEILEGPTNRTQSALAHFRPNRFEGQ